MFACQYKISWQHCSFSYLGLLESKQCDCCIWLTESYLFFYRSWNKLTLFILRKNAACTLSIEWIFTPQRWSELPAKQCHEMMMSRFSVNVIYTEIQRDDIEITNGNNFTKGWYLQGIGSTYERTSFKYPWCLWIALSNTLDTCEELQEDGISARNTEQ